MSLLLLPRTLVAWNNGFILLMIVWVRNLSRAWPRSSHSVLCSCSFCHLKAQLGWMSQVAHTQGLSGDVGCWLAAHLRSTCMCDLSKVVASGWLEFLCGAMASPRVSIPRECGRGCMAFCDLVLEVKQHHFCHTLLATAAIRFPIKKRSGHRLYLKSAEEHVEVLLWLSLGKAICNLMWLLLSYWCTLSPRFLIPKMVITCREFHDKQIDRYMFANFLLIVRFSL